VFGRWNDTEVRTFRREVPRVPLRAAFLADLALASPVVLVAVRLEMYKTEREGVGEIFVSVCRRKVFATFWPNQSFDEQSQPIPSRIKRRMNDPPIERFETINQHRFQSVSPPS
jgi:hypothetical protein